MMYGARIRITGELKLLSDLHIGSGAPQISSDNGETRERAVVIRGRNGPVIPATALKGVLRRALSTPDDALGAPSEHQDGSGCAARLWLENAELTGDDNSEFHRHVAISRESGAARDSHLYEREMVRRGARFAFAADWLGDDADKLAKTLAPLAAGISLGKGTSKGHGQVRLDAATLKIATLVPESDGELKETTLSDTDQQAFVKKLAEYCPNAAERTVTFKLTCDGPFISVAEIGTADGGEARNVARALMRDGKPWLHPESLIGALRSRAAWLAEVDRANNPSGAGMRPETIPMDDPKLEHALDGARRFGPEDDATRLSWVESLFGVTGLRARLRVVGFECEACGERRFLTSNSLDRVTGATREGFLFQRECYWNVVFKVKLALPEDAPQEVKTLLEDIQTNGLELGHGVTKGFGWFRVERVEDTQPGEGADDRT